MRRLIVSASIVVAVTTSAANPQDAPSPPASPPAFEVASVKPQQWKPPVSYGVLPRGNTFDAENVSLFSLVTYAYNLHDAQLSGGPPWIRCDGSPASCELFQVIAKAPEGPPTPVEAFRRMLQQLLADRFKLQIHHQPEALPVYNLVVRKGGPKLKESPAGAKSWYRISGQAGATRFVATHLTMRQLIDDLIDNYNGRRVFDKTGLAASYDFTLEYTPQDAPAADSNLPPLGAALRQQLGLTLEPSTAPFDTIVIDHAERPAPN